MEIPLNSSPTIWSINHSSDVLSPEVRKVPQAFPFLCHEFLCPIQQQSNIFLCLPFIPDVPVEFQVAFGFPNSIPACLASMSMCLLSYVSPFLHCVCCLLYLSLVRNSLFFNAGLLLPLLHFLLVGMDYS